MARASDPGNAPVLADHDHSNEEIAINNELDDLVCASQGVHEHVPGGTRGPHHHHTLACLVDAGRIKAEQELMPVKLDLVVAQTQIQQMSELVQRDAYTRQVLAPVVDLMALWTREAKRSPETPESLAIEFASHVARLLYEADGLLDIQTKWREQQQEALASRLGEGLDKTAPRE